MAQLTAGPRLLKLGEKIDFQFSLASGEEAGEFRIFPRYLEQADPGDSFTAGGDLEWVNSLPSERLAVRFLNGRAGISYQADKPGNYLARWRVGEEVFYRYFAVIEDDWIVLGFSPFGNYPEPTLHGTGIPLDYYLPADQYKRENPVFLRLLNYHRYFGDSIIPAFPDTPDLSMEERVRVYREGLDKARSLLPDPNDVRSARVDMHHAIDPGYTETFMQIGVNDHCGLNEANAKPWLGMPEFPYFASPVDCRKVNQEPGGSVVAHQWDFCGGWHFLGPVAWHYAASEGRWDQTIKCLREGMEEAKNLTAMSGHPAFLTPLYDGVLPWTGYPNYHFKDGWGGDAMLRFVETYQRQMAFEFTKSYKLAFMRTIDLSDYYRRHYAVTPRTVFVSRTDHVLYDMWWLCHWCQEGLLIPRERIPRLTRISSIMKNRRLAETFYKDPQSCEYILVEDQKRSIRFERESPNPIWWFDYTNQTRGPHGSEITHVETPDVDVLPAPWRKEDNRWTIELTLVTRSEFPDYAIALWGLPSECDWTSVRITTTAREHLLAVNREGERHLVLFFDLKPDKTICVSLGQP